MDFIKSDNKYRQRLKTGEKRVIESSEPIDGLRIVVVDTHKAYPKYFQEITEFTKAKFEKDDKQRRAKQLEYEAASGQERIRLKAELDNFKREMLPVPERLDQYWLEVVHQCVKLDLQAKYGFRCEFRFKDPGVKYAHSKYPQGRGVENAAGGSPFDAVNGKDARRIYKRMRGGIPGGE